MRHIQCILQLFLIFFVGTNLTSAQNQANFENTKFLKMLYNDTSYTNLKKKVISNFIHSQHGRWGEFVKGVDEDFITKQKLIAFTFDACGGPKRNGYDAELIDFMRKENIPATLLLQESGSMQISKHF